MINAFYHLYPHGNDWSFPDVRFRSGAAVSTKFDIFLQESWQPRKPYFHYAVDRGSGRIISPFYHTSEFVEDVQGYGSLLRIFPEGFDFELRIAHIEKLNYDYEVVTIGGNICPPDSFIAFAGQQGCKRADGVPNHHTHTELVSKGKRSEVLEAILHDSKKIHKEKDIFVERRNQANAVGLGAQFEEYCSARGLVSFTNYRCVRNDNQTGKRATYYSTALLNI